MKNKEIIMYNGQSTEYLTKFKGGLNGNNVETIKIIDYILECREKVEEVLMCQGTCGGECGMECKNRK